MAIIHVQAAGVTFDNIQEILRVIRREPDRYDVFVAPEPDNKYDENAIAVYAEGQVKTKRIGYLPKDLAKALHNKEALVIDFAVVGDDISGRNLGLNLTLDTTLENVPPTKKQIVFANKLALDLGKIVPDEAMENQEEMSRFIDICLKEQKERH